MYASADNMYSMGHHFDQTPRRGPKVWILQLGAKSYIGIFLVSILSLFNNTSYIFWIRKEFHRKSIMTYLQAFVSEYAATGNGVGKGSFLAALAQAGFLIGLETNRFFLCSLHYAHNNTCRLRIIANKHET